MSKEAGVSLEFEGTSSLHLAVAAGEADKRVI
jgi:hypothetical protein